VLAVLCGGLMVFAYSPYDLWIVAPLCLIIFFRQWRQCHNKRFLFAWLFGMGWFGAGVSWVHVSIADFGGLPLVASIALMALLCGYLALFPATVLWLTQRFFDKRYWPIAIAALWFLSENTRSWLLTGFPWLSVGYTQLNGPLSGWLPLIGETGVSVVLVLITACLGCWSIKKHWLHMILIGTVPSVSGIVLNGVSWTTRHQSHQITMVQGNIEQSMRWQPELDAPVMEKYVSLSAFADKSKLIIWPEAAIPMLEPLAQEFLFRQDALLAEKQSALITGIVNFNYENDDVFNSLIVLGTKNEQAEQGHYRYFHHNRYSKHHLLPIGEFVPFESLLRPLAPLFDLPMSSFTRGQYEQENLLANGINIAPAICFEIVFPRQIRRNLTSQTDLILTVSNDAWFGDSHGPAQHLQIAQVRAKEFGLPVARATNNGITAFIDGKGKITSQLPQFETATLTDTVISTRGITPYRVMGDWPMWLVVFSFLSFASLKKFKKILEK
jgi:apolipoprotein N-acyltransferase